MFFAKKGEKKGEVLHDFSYIPDDVCYFDSACQTMRPVEVMDAEKEYYVEYNACGHRVKYKWGERVDEKVEGARRKILSYVKKDPREYDVAFTLNTTYGINILLQQIDGNKYENIVTSDIEHNSVFLPTQVFAKRANVKRTVLERADDGSLLHEKNDLTRAIVVVNSTSNIDGRHLLNVKQLADDVHEQGGILILDAAQTMGHLPSLLYDVDFDAVCTSGHKMYGPSIGIMIVKKTFIRQLRPLWIGGGTVTDVQKDTCVLIDDDEELYARLETGLQNFAGICGLGATLDWIKSYKPEGKHQQDHTKELSSLIYHALQSIPGLHVLGHEGSSTFSMYHEKVDSHTLALYASQQNIMMRSGYFCCHYYLKNVKEYPPLLRMSTGLHNTVEQTQFALDTLERLFHSAS